MIPRPAGRPIPPIVGAILALAMLALAQPPTASGRCGDHAVSRIGREIRTAIADLDVFPADRGPHAAIPSAPIRKPCSGASCSGGPSRPVAPSLPGPMVGERWFNAPTPATLAPVGGIRLRIPEPSPIPVNRPDDLDRPPRSSST